MAISSTLNRDLGLLDYIVRDLIKRHGITAEEVAFATGDYQGRVWRLALDEARNLQPSTLGRLICALPNADLYGCHGGTWLGKYESGPYLVQQIVATVMICRMRWWLLGEYAEYEHYSHQTGPDWV